MRSCRLSQLAIPAGDDDVFDIRKSRDGGQVETVVGAKSVIDRGARSCLDQSLGHRMDVEFAPESIQIVERGAISPN